MKKKKQERFPVIFVEGGIVTGFAEPAKRGFRFPTYELVDYDVFEGGDVKDIVDMWVCFTPELQKYIQKNHPYEFGKFQDAIADFNAASVLG